MHTVSILLMCAVACALVNAYEPYRVAGGFGDNPRPAMKHKQRPPIDDADSNESQDNPGDENNNKNDSTRDNHGE